MSNRSDRVLKELEAYLRENGWHFHTDYSLRPFTSFKVGGPARYFVELKETERADHLYRFLSVNQIPFFILGGGTNLLVSDKGFTGVVIKPAYKVTEQLEPSGESVTFTLPSSYSTAKLGTRLSALGYRGFEFLSTVPGELGGAVVQNAGCYGSEICERISSVTYSEANGSIRNTGTSGLGFGYRTSMFKKSPPALIHEVTFHADKGDTKQINENLKKFREHRKLSQPENRKNAGSVFKNPPQKKAWELIDRVGLAGFAYGDAQISLKHANFILNNGNATSGEICYLINMIREKVEKETGITLENEIVILGEC